MDTSMVDTMNKGMRCLVEQLGVVEAEKFISIIIREKFDYTKWQRDFFDKMSKEQIRNDSVVYAETHPFKGAPKVVLRK